jgi:hypothetical protein
MQSTRTGKKVILILDRELGRGIKNLFIPGVALWIVSSAKNKAAADSLRQQYTVEVIGNDISVFETGSNSLEQSFLKELKEIDFHFGSYVASDGYKILEVIGLPYSPRLSAALSEHGFFHLSQTENGFVATRDGKYHWREQWAPEEVKRVVRQRLVDLLMLYSSESAQREFQLRFPLADAARDLFYEWYEGFSMPESFKNSSEIFSSEELVELRRIHEILEKKVQPQIKNPSNRTLDDFLARPEWRELMTAAAECLKQMTRS